MHADGTPFPPAGTDLGTLPVEVSAEAGDRYWRGAGIEHGARTAGLLYPPMAVNFTILLVQQTVSDPVLHTWGRLRCHAAIPAPTSLVVTGSVVERFEKRERDYFSVASEIRTADGELIWSAEVELASSRRRPGAGDSGAPSRPEYALAPAAEPRSRRVTLTRELLRTYSRAGNFHSQDAAARAMGLPGMVAMGMQTLGPACSLVLEDQGVECLAHAELEARFFGLVLEDDTVEATVAHDKRQATFAIRNVTKNVNTASGRLRLGPD